MTEHESSSFRCPKCQGKLCVVDSRPASVHSHSAIRRRRECTACRHRFTTFEVEDAEYLSLTRIKGKVVRALSLFREIVEGGDDSLLP